MLPENAGCIPSAVVMITTADGMHQTFSGRHPKLFILSDLYRVVTEIAEVHADIVRSALYPFYLKINKTNKAVYVTVHRMTVKRFKGERGIMHFKNIYAMSACNSAISVTTR